MRAIIIRKDKKVEIKKVGDNERIIRLRDGVYPIEEKGITNYVKDGEIKGSEIIFFEGNPNHIRDNSKDKSSRYLRELLIENWLEQTGSIKVDVLGYIREVKKVLSVRNMLLAIMFGGILYAILNNAGIL